MKHVAALWRNRAVELTRAHFPASKKRLAAMRAGISTVIIPKLNEKDLVDVPEEAKQKLKFVPVENVDEVLAAALEKNGASTASESKAG